MPFTHYPDLFACTADYKTEVIMNYQMGYLVDAALISLNFILDNKADYCGKFVSDVQFYRFYTDHLLFDIGQIHDYFFYPKKDEEMKRIISLNRTNYNYIDSDFKIISEKRPRNIMEHLIERNCSAIKGYSLVGGFIVLGINNDEALEASVTQNKDLYPYILDKSCNEISFVDYRKLKYGKLQYYSIDLIQLKNELTELKLRVQRLAKYLEKKKADN